MFILWVSFWAFLVLFCCPFLDLKPFQFLGISISRSCYHASSSLTISPSSRIKQPCFVLKLHYFNFFCIISFTFLSHDFLNVWGLVLIFIFEKPFLTPFYFWIFWFFPKSYVISYSSSSSTLWFVIGT